MSGNGGTTWRSEREFATPARRVWATRDALYVALERSIWVRENATWREGAAMPAPWTDISAGPPVIYAVTSEGGAMSEDGGATWRQLELPGTGARLRAIATSRNHPDVAYVSYSRLQ